MEQYHATIYAKKRKWMRAFGTFRYRRAIALTQIHDTSFLYPFTESPDRDPDIAERSSGISLSRRPGASRGGEGARQRG